MRSVVVSVSGPVSWSYSWPWAPVEHVLRQAASRLERLTPNDAPFGVYRVTVDGTTREVVRAPGENR